MSEMHRKRPFRHEVSGYTRRNGTKVEKYKRGQGRRQSSKSKRVVRLPVSRARGRRVSGSEFKDGKVSHEEYIYGDFDKDGTPNIDDEKPFDPMVSETVHEVLLSDELENLRNHSLKFKKATIDVAKNLDDLGFPVKFRIKNVHSIINKLRRRHIEDIKDIGGVLILVKSKREAYKMGKYVSQNYDVVEMDDYYRHPKKGYKALHYTLEVDNLPLEVQVKRESDYRKHLRWHKQYKMGLFEGPT